MKALFIRNIFLMVICAIDEVFDNSVLVETKKAGLSFPAKTRSVTGGDGEIRTRDTVSCIHTISLQLEKIDGASKEKYFDGPGER